MIETPDKLSRQELAWEFVALFDELGTDQINEVLAKNVPLETLEFFASYANSYGEDRGLSKQTANELPNLLLLGYLLRVLEERLITDNESYDA